jgi:hypothetical protein
MSRKKPGAERISVQDGRTIREIDELLSKEVLADLAAQSQGVPRSVGEMQRAYPDEYKAVRKLLLGIGQFAVVGSISFEQAKKISAMIHSEKEGLSSIQEILNMQPVNALTLVYLVRLERSFERSRRGRENADRRHNQPGGSREKKAELRAIWASGKYDTRVRCAEEEYEALGVSLHTAVKYLTNTPEPASR